MFFILEAHANTAGALRRTGKNFLASATRQLVTLDFQLNAQGIIKTEYHNMP